MFTVNSVTRTVRSTLMNPTVISTVAVAGFVTAVVLAVKATPQAVEVLYEAEEDLPEEQIPRIVEQVRILTPVYASTIGMCLLATGLVIFGTTLSKNRYAALATLYAVSERSVASWKEIVKDEVTLSSYDKIRSRVAHKELDPVEPPPTEDTVDKVLFFDRVSGRYFMLDSIEAFRGVILRLNENLYCDMFVSVNDLYYELKLPNIKYGEDIGWPIEDGVIIPMFDSLLTADGRPAVVIEFEKGPRHIYYRENDNV